MFLQSKEGEAGLEVCRGLQRKGMEAEGERCAGGKGAGAGGCICNGSDWWT